MTDDHDYPDLDPEGRRLPIKVDSTSNGEFEPRPLDARQRYANRLAHERVSETARRLGLSRRAFLIRACGAACTLLAFNEAHARAGASGGFFDLPADAAWDEALAAAVLGGEEFIFDIQNHCVDPAAGWRGHPDGDRWYYVLTNLFPQREKCVPGGLDCYSAEQLAKDVYLDSDTDMGVVSTLWGARAGNPIPVQYAAEAREVVERLGVGKRALIHGGVLPNEPGALESMDELAEHGVSAWKLYPQWGPQGVGFFLDDPMVGIPFLERVRELGPKVVCAHRGLPLPFLAYEYSHPRDMAAAAVLYPDIVFITYHSGFEPGVVEGPYDPDVDRGVNRLITAHRAHGFRPNEGNLYAELGSLWRYVMGRPEEAAHVLGKLLVHFGEDRICWGTDCIWYGSPQDQIQAFRTFQIAPELRERYGYPEITPEIRAKIFGLNAAAAYGIDVAQALARRRDELGRRRAVYRERPNPAFATWGPRSRREFLALVRARGSLPG